MWTRLIKQGDVYYTEHTGVRTPVQITPDAKVSVRYANGMTTDGFLKLGDRGVFVEMQYTDRFGGKGRIPLEDIDVEI